jgi:hypothetical protein
MPEDSFRIPTKDELILKGMLAPSQEERDLARMLSLHTPEQKEREHPLLLLKRMYPEGSEALRLAMLTPVGVSVEEICAAQPDEIDLEAIAAELEETLAQNQENQRPAKVAVEIAPDKPEPPPPAPPEPNKWDDLNYRLAMKRAESTNEPARLHKWQQAKPTPEPGWGHGEGLEPLS